MSNTARKASKYGVFMVLIFLHLVRIQENTDPKKSGHVSRSVTFIKLLVSAGPHKKNAMYKFP